MINALKWMTPIGIAALAVGFLGLWMAFRFHPDSNLLGGWALVLGPIYWLGWLLTTVSVFGWISAAIVVGIQKIRGN